MNALFSLLAGLATRHPWTVVIVWLLIMLAAAPFALRVDDALTKFGWDVGGSESKEAHDLIERELAQTFPQNLVVVFYSDEMKVDGPRFTQVVNATLARVQGD